MNWFHSLLKWCLLGWLRVWFPNWFCRGYACVISCIDGKGFEAIIFHFRFHYAIRWVDFRTKAGVNKLLCEVNDRDTLNNIMEDVITSKRRHDSQILAVAGHSKCAANPGSEDDQIKDLHGAAQTLDFFEIDIHKLLLFVDVDAQTVKEIAAEKVAGSVPQRILQA